MLSKNIMLRILLDCILILFLLIVALIIFKNFGEPVKRGFFCNDESLKYPYHSDTVTSLMLWLLSFYAPIILIIAGEIVLFLVAKCRTTTTQNSEIVKDAVIKFYHNITTFLCGFALTACFVQLAKITLGRLRPHFFDVCQPYRQLDGSTCDNPKNHGLYIQDYKCSAANNRPYITDYMIKNIHLSFPSGHSSYIFYSMIFIILYLQRFFKTLRNNKINIGLFMMVIQMCCALLASFVAMSRVTDYKHHWSDVLVGILLGTSVAIVVTLYVCEQLKSVTSWPADIKSSNSKTTFTTTFASTMPTTILVP